MTRAPIRFPSIAILAASLLLAACGAKVSGVYAGDDDSFFDSLTFKSGKYVEIDFGGETGELPYEIDGDRIRIASSDGPAVMRIDGKCLDGGSFVGRYCKK